MKLLNFLENEKKTKQGLSIKCTGLSMSLFLLLIMLQLMRREHKHRDRDFNWGIAKTGSMNGLLKCSMWADAILFSRPGQKSGRRQVGL